jgi:chemotaxis response regulator CheB
MPAVRKIRVPIIDDSAIVRKILTEALSAWSMVDARAPRTLQ